MALFDERADESLARVKATYSKRGSDYGDTWRDCQWITLGAAASKCGLPKLTVQQMRVLAAAALVDVKYQRNQGGYNVDNEIDGIAYKALFLAEMDRLDDPVRVNGLGIGEQLVK